MKRLLKSQSLIALPRGTKSNTKQKLDRELTSDIMNDVTNQLLDKSLQHLKHQNAQQYTDTFEAVWSQKLDFKGFFTLVSTAPAATARKGP